MVLFKKKQPVEIVGLDPNKLDEVRLRVFVTLMDTIKAEAGRTAQEFRALQAYRHDSMNDNAVLIYDERRVDELIAELNSFRKHLAVAHRRAPDMIVMLNRATH